MANTKKSVIFHGFGNTGLVAAKKLLEKKDYKIIGITEGNHAVYSPIGLDPVHVKKYLEEKGTLKGYGYDERDENTSEEIVVRRCDIVVITTPEFSFGKDLASRVDCKFVFEGSNIPITKEANEILYKKGIIVIPDLIASAGNQICGYIEWLKNLEHRNLTMLFKRFESKIRSQFIKLLVEEGSSTKKLKKYEGPTENDLVETTIEEMIHNAFEDSIKQAILHNTGLRTACYKIALERIYSSIGDDKMLLL